MKNQEMNRKQEQILHVPLSELHPFRDHPFKVMDDERMEETVESIRAYGVLVPIIVRPKESGGYEIISGHRRCHASGIVGLETVPVIVRDLDDDEATLVMVDSNLQREGLLPSERARAYKMKLDTMKRQGQRRNFTSAQIGQKSRWSVEQIAEEVGNSKTQVQRYIRLTELIPELLDMVDEKKINFNSAVELSYLPQGEQQLVYETIVSESHAPSVAQAKAIKQLSRKRELSDDSILTVFGNHENPRVRSEPTENRSEQSPQTSESQKTITFPMEPFMKYFPNRSEQQIKDMVLKIVDTWHRHYRNKKRYKH